MRLPMPDRKITTQGKPGYSSAGTAWLMASALSSGSMTAGWQSMAIGVDTFHLTKEIEAARLR